MDFHLPQRLSSRVGGGSVRPNLKEHRALQNELVTADWLRRYSSRSSVAGENQPQVFGLPHTDIEQFLTDRCCHIAELARFQTRASMYGRMMFATRHTLAAATRSAVVALRCLRHS